MTHPTTEQRELLELAAKAAGVALRPMEVKNVTAPGDDHWVGYMTDPDVWPRGWFDPLTDDGDALRLAVKLGMQIDTRDPETRIYAMGAGDVVTEYHANRNALAATRLAIVRAAAAIAKGEKE